MINIGIINCAEVAKKCSGTGCINAFNENRGSFDKYVFKDAEIVSFAQCHGCSENATEGVVIEANKMKDKGVKTIHISTCIRGRCKWYSEFVDELSRNFEVVDYTHGRKK